MGEKTHKIIIGPGKKITVKDNANLLRALQEEGYPIQSPCGGEGTCGKCRVRVLKGAEPPTETEKKLLDGDELTNGVRLSCVTSVKRDMVVEILDIAQPAEAKEALNKLIEGVAIGSGIEKHYLKLPLPGRDDQRPDTERIADGLGKKPSFPLSILKRLPAILRENDFKITVTVGYRDRILGIEPGNSSDRSYGIAFDIGTATIAGYLLNLNTGEELGVRSTANPQERFGTDVISRIKHVHDNGEKGLRELQNEVLSAVNSIIEELCSENEISPSNIYKATFVGNPTMMHLFAGIDPSYIDHSPYIPVLKETTSFLGEELNIKMNAEGEVYILPNVSAYLGADIVAGVLYTKLHKSDKLKLLVDIGTNGEIVLGNKDKILACSAAAGPAFEGARIQQGMSAQVGAISYVDIDEQVRIKIIGDGEPKGICGSGLVDAVGQLRKANLIAPRGNFKPRPELSINERLIKAEDGQMRFILAEANSGPIYLTQKDIRELQLAKGAIRAGIEILLEEMGVAKDEIDQVFLAGAFGNFLRAENVLRIGLLPDIPVRKIIPVGNAAGQGAKLCLINRDELNEVGEIIESIEYLELSYRPDFNNKFIKRMRFPEEIF